MRSPNATSPDVLRSQQALAKFELNGNPTPKKSKPPPRDREPALTKADRARFASMEFATQPATSEETWFRHSGWEFKRAKVLTALEAVGTTAKNLEAFRECGAAAVVEYCESEKKYRIRGQYCKCRHCEPCARAKAALLAGNLRNRLEQQPEGRYRFITLTLKHSDEPLADQIKRLYTSFRNLRSRPQWSTTQHGGASILEVKWDQKTRRWHPHLHIVAEGGFLKQELLSTLWHSITGDSFVVDIRQLDNAKDAAFYVAKYVSKGTNGEVWHDLDAATEWITAMKGVRSCTTFGKWRGFKLLAKRKDEHEWKRVDLLREIIAAARRREQWAIELLKGLIDSCHYDPHKPRTRQAAANAEKS